MGDGPIKFTLDDRLELLEYEQTRGFAFDRIRFPLGPYISGVEVTQSIQYYKANLHLTDVNDRRPDNSLRLAAFKPAWVRVFVRSGFFNGGAILTGKLIVERKKSLLPVFWDLVGEFTPRAPGTVVAQVSANYATERGSIASSLNFILPADEVRGALRITAVVWPQGGTSSSPSDTEKISIDAMLHQTLRVRGIFVSYNGPNAAGTVANMNLPAPTLANLQTSCGITHTVFPVESTGVYSSGGNITWSTPLTGMATNPGGCSSQWLALNVAVAQARTNDGNRIDVLYVGLLPASIPIANVGGCNSSGVSAVPNGNQWTMAHELGHAAGLAHGPCGTPGDSNYPAYEPYDPANSPTASLGEYGLDINNGDVEPLSALRIVQVDSKDLSPEKAKRKEIWRREAGESPPRVVSVTARVEKREGIIRWEVKASSNENLEFSIQFSKDKRKSWNGLVAGLRTNSYRFSIAELPSGPVVFRVLAHDGFYSTTAEGRPVTIPLRPPIVSILHPNEGRTYPAGQPLRLFAAVSTHLGALNPALRITWQIDGKKAGEGAECWIDSPKPGRHKCRVVARDDGGEAEATVTFVTEGETRPSKTAD
jgi:hypothetical protein